MKTLITFIVALLFLSSCGVARWGGKPPIYLLDAPDSLEITNSKTGEKLQIIDINYKSQSSYDIHSKDKMIGIHLYAPGIRFKPVGKSVSLTLNHNGVTKTVEIKEKVKTRTLIIEGVLTAGLFTIIDLVAGGAKEHSPKYLDVPAILEGRSPRSKKELKNSL
jgi:hypothetical protein